MTAKPCAIADCPALALKRSSWCVIHAAMTVEERDVEQEAAERRKCRLRTLTPVTDRIEYEKKP